MRANQHGRRSALGFYHAGAGALWRWFFSNSRRLVLLWRSMTAPRRRVRLPRRPAV